MIFLDFYEIPHVSLISPDSHQQTEETEETTTMLKTTVKYLYFIFVQVNFNKSKN